jgi:putative ABC transport system permease protein
MIKILFRNSLRSLIKQTLYSSINILGLIIGVASVLLLITWISVETSFDKFHKDSERLYRVGLILKTPNKEINSGSINAPAGPEYKREFPVIEEMVRFTSLQQTISYNDRYNQLEVYFADSTFFKIFSFDLVKGDKTSCLESPQSIVLTETALKKVFGTEDPLGKGIMISGKTYTVTAVAKDPPVNTNMQFECIASFSVIEKQAHIGWDGGLTCYTYLKLIKDSDPALLEKQILDYMEGVINKKYREFGYSLIPYLQKISDIHLDSKTDYDLGEKGSKMQVYLFAGIGLLILLIACFNFVNISTALSFRRAKEVSIKKIFGSDRKNVIIFFVFESAVTIIISLLFAFLLVRILLPFASSLSGKVLTLSVIEPYKWLLIYISLFLFCTVFASFYSSVYLSSANPLSLLTNINKGKKKQVSRNVLVTFQYTISIALIICCLVIFSQMQYVKNSDKGFNENDILLVDLNSKMSATNELIKSKFASVPGVLSVSVSSGGAPGLGFTSNGYLPEGVEKPIMANAVYVDENYLKTMGISLIDGRDFRNSKADSNKVIINETFAKLIGWNKPTGKSISRNGIRYEVIGEVKDFTTSSLHNKIEPIFISTVNEWGKYDNIIIKYQPSNISGVLKSSESILKEIDPQSPFEYEFLKDTLSFVYSRDQKLNSLFLVLSVIAIFISSLGLFGLATFATQSRMKEISIRKINGATIPDILSKFNYELLKWILVSFVIACPIGYYAMGKWLNNFAYKTTIGLWIFISSGILAIAVGLLTVSLASIKAAKSNPAETLRKD